MEVNVSPKVRDIEVNLENSCNCCCFGRRSAPKLNTAIYVQSDGIGVAFDNKKATSTQDAIDRTYANVIAHITQVATDHKKEPMWLIETVEATIEVSITKGTSVPISLDIISRINRAMITILNAEKE